MDVFERANRRFGSWYEGLFGAGEGGDLRPRDVLRRILTAMEDARREGLDGNVYVPNVYAVRVVVASDEERDYIRTFLNAEELAVAVRQSIEQHGYRFRGSLYFTVEEATAGANVPRLSVHCRFDPTNGPAPSVEVPGTPPAHPAPPVPVSASYGFGGASASPDPNPPTIPASSATLTLYGPGGQAANVYPLTPRGARVGRAREFGNDIVVEDGMVSKRHARIACEGGGFVVYDEGSTNGTYVSDAPVPPGVAVPLRSGDEIRVGDTRLRFLQSGGGSNPNVAPDQLPTVAAPKGNKPNAAAPADGDTRFDWAGARPAVAEEAVAFRLLGANGETYPLASEMTVGRALTGDITLIGAGVSSQHARLSIRGNALYVEDLAGPGGTFVNGERIPANFSVVLYDGDDVAFGEVTLRVQKFTVGREA
jgi:pSer/pThr/pTyr-binding forkhead associated (FHA) protein